MMFIFLTIHACRDHTIENSRPVVFPHRSLGPVPDLASQPNHWKSQNQYYEDNPSPAPSAPPM